MTKRHITMSNGFLPKMSLFTLNHLSTPQKDSLD